MSSQVRSVPETLREWPGHTGNWGRWPNDRGAVNLLGPQTTLRAVASVRDGNVISCAREVSFTDPLRPGPAGGLKMLKSLYPPGSKYNALGDDLTIRTHGIVNTHIDAFCHVGMSGFGFNGLPYDEVITMEEGGRQLDVTGHGPIVTRGVLVDVPRQRNVAYLQPGEWATLADIEPVLQVLEPGDAILIRTGVTLHRGLPPDEHVGHHGTLAGVHWQCLEALAKKDITVFATDCGADVYPGPKDKPVNSPVHALCLVMYGIPIVHNMDLETLARTCHEQQRNTFMFVVAPLNIPRATGSVVTPVAIL